MRDIYAFFGIDFTGQSVKAAKTWWETNPPNKEGVHRYSLDDWGLSERMVNDFYGAYRERFGEYL